MITLVAGVTSTLAYQTHEKQLHFKKFMCVNMVWRDLGIFMQC